jgi:hypothetical protein
MPGKQRYSKQQVISALREAKGMASLAARKLGCDVDTVLIYCKRYSDIEAVKQEARIEILDEAELRLWQAIRRDESWAIAFCLKTLGRTRGYGERLDLNVSIQAAAQRVAQEFGLSASDVLAEARLLLLEVENDAQ